MNKCRQIYSKNQKDWGPLFHAVLASAALIPLHFVSSIYLHSCIGVFSMVSILFNNKAKVRMQIILHITIETIHKYQYLVHRKKEKENLNSDSISVMGMAAIFLPFLSLVFPTVSSILQWLAYSSIHFTTEKMNHFIHSKGGILFKRSSNLLHGDLIQNN